MNSKPINIAATAIFILTNLMVVTLAIITIFGAYQAFSKEGILSGVLATFIPPYAWYVAYDTYYYEPIEEKFEKVSVVFHIEHPVLGKTSVAGFINAPSLEICNRDIPKLKNEMFEDFRLEQPSMISAKLLKAECVAATDIGVTKIEQPTGYVEPIVIMALKTKAEEPAIQIFPTPVEGWSLEQCHKFFNGTKDAEEWKKMAHFGLKNMKPKQFSNSEILGVQCIESTKEVLNYLKYGGIRPW